MINCITKNNKQFLVKHKKYSNVRDKNHTFFIRILQETNKINIRNICMHASLGIIL